MDKVFITGLEAHAIIGVYSWEQCQSRKLIFDLELCTDLTEASHSDDVNKTIDYYAVAEQVRAFCAEHRFELIETLAEKVAQLLLAEFPCQKVRLKLHKPGAVPFARSLGVEIERSR